MMHACTEDLGISWTCESVCDNTIQDVDLNVLLYLATLGCPFCSCSAKHWFMYKILSSFVNFALTQKIPLIYEFKMNNLTNFRHLSFIGGSNYYIS